MKLIMFKGISKTGKTTSAEAVISELRRRGFTVGSVKDIHFEGFTMETPGSNTDRHKKAGAAPVTARGLAETDIMFPESLDIERILENYHEDWVVLEGDSGANCPNIVTGRTPEELDRKIDGRTIAVAGVFANRGAKEYRGLPVLSARDDPKALVDFIVERTPERMPNFDTYCCSECGEDGCRGLLEGMLKGTRGRSECTVKDGGVQLFIDGREITIVDFVKDMLGGALRGMVKELDGYREGAEIVIKMK
ncbi:MAG: molybdopterin-guanine dinucleotide biosynthesis protein MobB [Anaerovoracaceae bacterium]|jgi:molybdopterin-guanine dinucleotide biosynthesis protein B